MVLTSIRNETVQVTIIIQNLRPKIGVCFSSIFFQRGIQYEREGHVEKEKIVGVFNFVAYIVSGSSILTGGFEGRYDNAGYTHISFEKLFKIKILKLIPI